MAWPTCFTFRTPGRSLCTQPVGSTVSPGASARTYKTLKTIVISKLKITAFAAALVLAERGHEVDLYEAAAKIGGQLNMAKVIPGKEEFHEGEARFEARTRYRPLKCGNLKK